MRRLLPTLILLSALILQGCGTVETEAKYPSGLDRNTTGDDIYGEKESIFGGEGISLFGGKGDKEKAETSGIGVNSFLWRASLDTVSFMPLTSADPFGGTILTDWYSPPDVEDERFKINVFILGRQLRSDGVRVRAFRQVLKNGTWHDAEVSESTATQLEDTILTRARQLRFAQVGGVAE